MTHQKHFHTIELSFESHSELLSGQIFKDQRSYCVWGHKMVTYCSWACVWDFADKIILSKICKQLSQEVNKWKNIMEESLIHYVIFCFNSLTVKVVIRCKRGRERCTWGERDASSFDGYTGKLCLLQKIIWEIEPIRVEMCESSMIMLAYCSTI